MFFPNSNSFGVFSHSKGFGAEFFGLILFVWFVNCGLVGWCCVVLIVMVVEVVIQL